MDHSIPEALVLQMGKEEQPQCTLPVSHTPSVSSSTRVSLLEPSEQKARAEKKRQIYLKFAEKKTEKKQKKTKKTKGIKEVVFSKSIPGLFSKWD